jgi:hypothetical protein
MARNSIMAERWHRGRQGGVTAGTVISTCEALAFCACALPLGAFQMLAWILLVVSTPTIVSTTCSAFLAYKERPQWIWFAVLAVLAEIGGVVMLAAVQAQRLTY